MRYILTIFMIMISVVPAYAQSVVMPCIFVTTNGVTTCQPITSANPLPVTHP